MTSIATNLDLFLEHGSTPEGPGPTFSMPAWGDKKLLTPQQIADVIAYVISLNPRLRRTVATALPERLQRLSAGDGHCQPQTEPEPTEEVARPSNPGGPGPAVEPDRRCHFGSDRSSSRIARSAITPKGKGGNPNPGSS